MGSSTVSAKAKQGAAVEEEDSWRHVGTVVGNAGIAEYTLILQQFQARVGDIVAVRMEVSSGDYASRHEIYVWARITDISRFNPFFPYEAAQEIAWRRNFAGGYRSLGNARSARGESSDPWLNYRR